IKNFIKRNTPTRPELKLLSLQEKERQRLESLRKKQEAEEQRRKKVEEEKKRRQAEMKQKREERLRKALQARERVEQMEEEKKKRMEQKMLQSDEKGHLSQARDEKGTDERSKRKASKKHGEADARKQRALRGDYKGLPLQEEDELEQQEALQKRREAEVKEKGKKVLELRNLVEQRQLEQMKERYWLLSPVSSVSVPRDHKLRGKEKVPQPPPEPAAAAGKSVKVGSWGGVGCEPGGCWAHRLIRDENQATRSTGCSLWHMAEQNCQGEPWLQQSSHKTRSKSISMSCLEPPKGTKDSRSPKGSEDNYGMDLNSDDSTDDENDPRKPVPAWADGPQLNQAILHQYYHPVNVDQVFGLIPSPKLEDIFGKSKPRYFKRTSSAVWNSPP
ncbi:INCE protein, partial [Urocolius indicus]|nr:INCE protein [Urocolius indicus]